MGNKIEQGKRFGIDCDFAAQSGGFQDWLSVDFSVSQH